MKIEVIGYKGIVGGATYQLFKRLGYKVYGSDKGDAVGPADIYFICVPEGVVQSVVGSLRNTDGLIVIRSSVPPTTCKTLQSTLGRHICHIPEFLRQAMAIQDEMNPDRIVIGECCKEHGDLLEGLFRPMQRPIVRTDPTTSELAKLASNNFLSCIISYWNTIEGIAERIGVSGHEVGMIASLDHRIPDYGARLHGKYGGMCFPKDAKQLIAFAETVGYDPVLLRAMESVNNKLKEGT